MYLRAFLSPTDGTGAHVALMDMANIAAMMSAILDRTGHLHPHVITIRVADVFVSDVRAARHASEDKVLAGGGGGWEGASAGAGCGGMDTSEPAAGGSGSLDISERSGFFMRSAFPFFSFLNL
jgi:hypothetical protein